MDAANEYHLWVLPEGLTAPYGFEHKAVLDASNKHDHALYRQGGQPVPAARLGGGHPHWTWGARSRADLQA